MKKNQNKTDELLAKLGASLKESPLVSHARQISQSESATATATKIQTSQMNATAGGATATKSNIGEAFSKGSKFGTGEKARLEQVSQKMVAAAQQVIRPEGVTAIFSNEAIPDEGIITAIGASMPIQQNKAPAGLGLAMAESFLDMLDKTGAPLNKEQVLGLQKLKEEGATLAQKGGLESALEGVGAPLNEAQREQIKEIQTLKEVLEEIKLLQKHSPAPTQNKQTVAAQMPAAPQATMPTMMPMVAVGSMRHAMSGWRTSTVGLYPEDYEKAYASMQYLTQQTGQAVNLSRVVKIALRALEIGPRLLEVNSQVRQRDRRVLKGTQG